MRYTKAKLAVLILAAVTVTMMLLRFLEQWLLARALGAGQMLDAYFLGQIVVLLGAQLAVAVTSTAIPILTSMEGPERKAAARRLFSFTAAVVIATLGVVAAASAPIVGFLQGSLDHGSARLAGEVFLWLLPATGACILAALLRAYWHAGQNFFLPGVGQLLMPLCTCGGAMLVAVGLWNLQYAAAVANVGAILLVVLLSRPLLLGDDKSTPSQPQKLIGLGNRFGVALIPVTATLILIPAMVAACRSIASWLAPGSVTAISLAVSLASIPGQIAAASVGMVLLPQTSSLLVAGRNRDAAGLVERSLRTSTFIVMPCAIFVLFRAREAVEIVFRRGAFDIAAVHATTSALIGFSFGIPVLASMQVLTFALLATHRTKQVAFTAIATLALHILLSRAFLHFGLIGLAGAFSLACLLNACALLWLLEAALPELKLRTLLLSHMRILAVSVAAGTPGSIFVNYLGITNVIESFLVTIIVIATLYLGLSLLVGSPEMREILGALRQRPRATAALSTAK